ncbi:hypothetical protein [Oceanobacillus locisalsi]|uniref:Uncharacterized protein n=1 Tax=Oceanobacillus locisalsi TaxID=546107 RepID=A0ABW3NG64_9BACI
MKIVIDRINFHNEEVYADGNCTGILSLYVEIDYNANVGNEWLQGTLEKIPYDNYIKLTHDELIKEIELRLK